MASQVRQRLQPRLWDHCYFQTAPAKGSVPRVRQVAYVVGRAAKPEALGRVLDIESPQSALVFCRTRSEVDELTESLGARGYRAEAIHGGLTQDQRDRVMKRFREGTADLLVATDVAARGLDIPHLSHVVNYDLPASPEMYVHRTGRTGRAGREGVAITLVQPREERMLRQIEKLTRQKLTVQPLPDNFVNEAAKISSSRAPTPVSRDEANGRRGREMQRAGDRGPRPNPVRQDRSDQPRRDARPGEQREGARADQPRNYARPKRKWHARPAGGGQRSQGGQRGGR